MLPLATAGATTGIFYRKCTRMNANVAFGNGWRMNLLMNGRMGSLPHGPHWKIPPDGLAAAWVGTRYIASAG